MAMQIEKGVALPDGGLRGRKARYPFDDMEVGDSFFIEAEGDAHAALYSRRVRAMACNNQKPHYKKGWKFTVRLVEGGVRCWRIA